MLFHCFAEIYNQSYGIETLISYFNPQTHPFFLYLCANIFFLYLFAENSKAKKTSYKQIIVLKLMHWTGQVCGINLVCKNISNLKGEHA